MKNNKDFDSSVFGDRDHAGGQPYPETWLPIETADKSEDAAPIDVWVVHPESQWRVADVIWDGEDWVSDDCGDAVEWVDSIGLPARITHWMPVPLPPANVASGKDTGGVTDEQ